MSNRFLQGQLRRFRESENQRLHMGIILTDSADLRRLAAAWSAYAPAWEAPEEEMPEAEGDMWQWLWRGVQMDWRALSQRAMVGRGRIQLLFGALRENKLVYPDGTVPDMTKAVLQNEIAKSAAKKK